MYLLSFLIDIIVYGNCTHILILLLNQIKCKNSEMIAYKQYISNVLIFVRFKLARKSKQNIKFYYLQANILWRDVI